MDQFKWGIVGSLEKARAFAADLPNTSGQHLLYAFVPTAGEGEKMDVPHTYNDLQELLQSEVDAIYVASPYMQHYAQVKQCLLHGKPVLCERPVAASADELKHLMQLSEHNHVFMMEAMWIRFLPSIKKVLSIISSGAIGEIISVKASVSYKPSDGAQAMLNSGGGALFELGIYPVFLSTLLLGKPEYVQATGKLKEGGDNDFFSAFLSYEGGQYAFIETTKLFRGTSAATITGDKGAIQIKNPWSVKPEGIEVDFFDGTKVLHKSEWEGYGLQFELDEVYECVQNNEIESQLYCHHFSLDVLETMDSIRSQLE
jgi:scyllo-inositol 2-dehydrogenase (NADP+)